VGTVPSAAHDERCPTQLLLRHRDGTKLARSRLSRYRREPKVGMEADLPVYIAFGDPPVSLDGLYEINKHLADFLSLFEELL